MFVHLYKHIYIVMYDTLGGVYTTQERQKNKNIFMGYFIFILVIWIAFFAYFSYEELTTLQKWTLGAIIPGIGLLGFLGIMFMIHKHHKNK